MSHPLDNPVWASLSSHHAGLARKDGHAARYPADAAPFVAVDRTDADAAAQLAGLVEVGESVLLVGMTLPLPSTWRVQPLVRIAQMTCDSAVAVDDGPTMRPLSHDDVADMLALTALVYPHYFRPRTIEMGRYLGIHEDGRLVAMAGERMRFDGHQEISAICTHPAHTGRGHARRLLAALGNDILDRGELPFLHVSHRNARAKSLYERMGYVFRTDIALLEISRRG
ncbi:MAG TPA: GNAT family N-acetyltransferase [Pseudoxanthomonas sp.]|nr:GNAT family N-acetyltransferase [Pseudoxanthomonas sp.]